MTITETFRSAKVGDIIPFGTYPQTESGTDRTPIQWRVLRHTDEELFVLSEYILACRQFHGDAKPYQTEDADIAWQNCDLRKWLNEHFYHTAFDPIEQAFIKTNRCFDNGEGSPDTDDKVFLLSDTEVKELTQKKPEDESSVRRCTIGTEFARQKTIEGNHLYVYDKKTREDYLIDQGLEIGCSWWWLRSQVAVSERAFFVGTGSSIRNYGRVNLKCYGVRPAIKIVL
ncbi:MAG: DUF6273 domain-containing protein [Erysipelotrichaceae bacterium]